MNSLILCWMVSIPIPLPGGMAKRGPRAPYLKAYQPWNCVCATCGEPEMREHLTVSRPGQDTVQKTIIRCSTAHIGHDKHGNRVFRGCPPVEVQGA